MKSQFRNLARKMSTWPVIGRFVQIGIGIVRLPNIKQRQFEFDTVQLPSLTENMAELKAGTSTLEAKFSELDTKLSELKSQLSEIRTGKSELEVELSEHDNIIQSIDAQRPLQKNLLDSAPAAFRNLARDIIELRGGISNTSNILNLLGGRIEFVRRELMYEKRYGASSLNGTSGGLKTKIEILSPEKLKTARKERMRLNLGCGHMPLDGYLNVDRRALPGIDIVADVDELPFEQGEIDEIFSSHLLEHFPEEELKRVLLNYWFDLLKPGGVFRAVVPDCDGMIKAYTSGEYPFQRLRDVTYGAQDYDGDFHFNMFTTSSLSKLLAEAGFVDIRVIEENRENYGCKEFEISARRKEAD